MSRRQRETINKKKVAIVVTIVVAIIALVIGLIIYINSKKVDTTVNVELEKEIEEEKPKTIEEIVDEFGGTIIEDVNEDTFYVSKEDKIYTVYLDGSISEGKITLWDGSESQPSIDEDNKTIAVNNGPELKWIASRIISGEKNFSGYTISINQDIDLGARKNKDTGEWTGNQWVSAIGFLDEKAETDNAEVVETNSEVTEENLKRFSGILNGNNHSIRGLYIDSSTRYQGLIGFNAGEINNLTIASSYIKGDEGVGAFAGLNLGLVNSCNLVNTSVEGSQKVGGFVGINMTNSSITECRVLDFNSYVKAPTYAGGIVGYLNNNSEIRNCINNINVTGNTYVGGISGIAFYGSTLIGNINSSKNVIGEEYVGGLVGYSQAEINTCSSLVDAFVSGTNYVGGIVGSNYTMGNILNCYNGANVKCIGDNVGGIVGINNSVVNSCYNLGTVYINESNGVRIGGICGQNSSNSIIQKCYNVGNVKNETADGTVGANFGTAENLYCLSGLDYGNNANGKIVDEEELKNNIVSELGDSFKADEDRINNGFPILHWQGPAVATEEI